MMMSNLLGLGLGLLLIQMINNSGTLAYESTINNPKISCPKYCECNEININTHQLNDVIYQQSTVINNNKAKLNQMLNIRCMNSEYLIKIQNKNIYKLDLSNINIKKFNSLTINNLYNLHILNISYNSIVDLSQQITLTQLTHIYLQHNNISTISYTFLPQSIKYIDISYNNLQYIPDNFNNLVKLQYLNLIGNQHMLCTCFNYLSIQNLMKRLIVVDYDRYCSNHHNHNQTYTTWNQFNKHTKCINNNQQDQDHLNDHEHEQEGSGDDSTVDSSIQSSSIDVDNTLIDLTNDNKGKLDDDDLNEYIPVINNESTKMINKSTNDDLIISDKTIPDFYFNDTNKQEPEYYESGSGDDDGGSSESSLVDHDDDIIIPTSSSDEYDDNDLQAQSSTSSQSIAVELVTDHLNIETTTTENDLDDLDDYDYGSGSGSGAIDTDIGFEYDSMSSSSTTERDQQVPLVIVHHITSSTPAEPSTTTTTTSTEAPTTTTTTTTEAAAIEPPIIKVESTAVNEREKIRMYEGDASKDNINEELGQVIKEANASPSIGAYALLSILVIVVIALIGYTMIKRRVRHQNQHNNNNQQQLSTGGRNGTTGGLGNNGIKKMIPLEDDKYAQEMVNMRQNDNDDDDEKTVALLNQENELRKPSTNNGNGTVVNERSPMMHDPSDDHLDNQLSVPTTSGGALDYNYTQPSPIPSPRTIDNSGAVEKVKITMTELTDSIPKTPVLVTRTKSFTKDGPQIIVTPNLNQRPTVQK